MLPRKTFFVAGAGTEIDMPLGDALSAKIANKTDNRFEALPFGDRGLHAPQAC